MKNKLNFQISLLEIIISILIFAICSAVVVNCFIIARYTQIKANDKSIGIMKAQSILEYIKSTNNIEGMNRYLSNEFAEVNYNDSRYVNYYDENWNICGKDKKEYLIVVEIGNELIKSGQLININVSAERVKPYPLIGKGSPLILLSTSSFFPSLQVGGQ